jgi:hypothetical protein
VGGSFIRATNHGIVRYIRDDNSIRYNGFNIYLPVCMVSQVTIRFIIQMTVAN